MSQDDFNFKPMSSGLGFHQKQQLQKPIRPEIKASPQIPRTNLTAQQPPTLPRSSSLTSIALSTERNELFSSDLTNEYTKVFVRATLFKRAVAYFIDLSLVAVISAGLVACIFTLTKFTGRDLFHYMEQSIILNMYLPLFLSTYFSYFLLLESLSGKTLGKFLCDIQVVKVGTDEVPGVTKTLLRTAFNLVSVATLGLLSIYEVINWSLGLKVIEKK